MAQIHKLKFEVQIRLLFKETAIVSKMQNSSKTYGSSRLILGGLGDIQFLQVYELI